MDHYSIPEEIKCPDEEEVMEKYYPRLCGGVKGPIWFSLFGAGLAFMPTQRL
jgi:hypothetical protein